MGERLTDEQLSGLERIIVGDDGVRPIMFPWMAKAIEEIRERRAQDLNAEEHNALRSLQRELIAESETLADYGANVVVVAALSKLLTRGNR